MPFSLSLAPVQTELNLRPFVPASQVYNLENTSSSPITLTLEVRQWQPLGNTGSVQFLDDPGPFSFTINNANLQGQKSFIIPAKSKQQIVLGIYNQVTSESEYYYSVIFGQKNSEEISSGTTTGAIGSHLILHVTTNQLSENTIKILNLNHSRFVDSLFPSLTITGNVQNTSSHFFKLKGSLTLSKNQVVVQKLTLAGQTVLSQHTRSLECVDDPQKPEPQIIPCVFHGPLPPGIYQITLIPSPELKISNNIQTIYVFPYYTLFIFGFILIIMVLFIFSQKRR